MALTHALANMGHPILPETPLGYEGKTGFSVQQPQVDMPETGQYDTPKNTEYSRSIGKVEDKMQDDFKANPLTQLLGGDFEDILDARRDNIGYQDGKPVLFDARFPVETSNPRNKPLSIAYQNLSAPHPALIEEGGYRPSRYSKLDRELRNIGHAKEELPEFLENYRQGDLFEPWINAQDEGPVIPEHQRQLDAGLAQYRNYGDTLQYFNTLVNDPAQKRLYEFDDPQYKENVEYMQSLL